MSCLAVWLLALASLSGCMAADASYYRGAVVDYQVIRNGSTDRENFMINVRRYGQLIAEASEKKSDIIVFPEGGLGGRSIFIAVPDPADKVIPANDTKWDEALRNLSSYAITYKIYVVVNLHENYTIPNTKNNLKYNTNLVFDRNGTVISRYRKYHLYGESVNTTTAPEYSTFETDFNVTFGQFICFDILFQEPALNLVTQHKIKNFVFPSMWFSELPFLTAPQAQWSWAVGNNVNLLAAGINDASRGSGGSSIIPGRSKYWEDLNYVFTNKNQTTLIVANILKDPSAVDPTFLPQYDKSTVYYGEGSLNVWTQPNWNNFTQEVINMTANQNQTTSTTGTIAFKKQLCNGRLCCNFDVNITYGLNLVDTIKYVAVAFSGDRVFRSGPTKHGIEICAVYAYNNTPSGDFSGILFGPQVRQVTFDAVKISGNFLQQDAEILPNVLLLGSQTASFLPSPVEVSFDTTGNATLSWNPKKQLVTVGIHSRVFKTGNSPGGSASLSATILPIAVAALLSIMKYY